MEKYRQFLFENTESIYNNLPPNAYKTCELLRLAGYKAKIPDIMYYTDEISFTRRIGNNLYPRFHLVANFSQGVKINFHIDNARHKAQFSENGLGNQKTQEISRILGVMKLLSDSRVKEEIVLQIKENALFALAKNIDNWETKNSKSVYQRYINKRQDKSINSLTRKTKKPRHKVNYLDEATY